MREMIQMLETLERPRVGDLVPDILYLGTSLSAWEQIKKDDIILGNQDSVISFTTEWHTAQEAAKAVASRLEEEKGIVIEFNGDALARKFKVEPLSQEMAHAEQSWKITADRITQADRYILGVSVVR